MVEVIEALIREAERWQIMHRSKGRQIEALACAIRAKAMRDVLKALEDRDG